MLTLEIEGGCLCGEIQRFRKEPAADNRRLAQFMLFEIEHLGDLDNLLGHLRGIVRAAANGVAAKRAKELALFGLSERSGGGEVVLSSNLIFCN